MAKDLSGQRFGKLTALRLHPEPYRLPSGKPTRRWVCLCDCGNETIVLQSALTTGKNPTKSCGCGNAEARRKAAKDLTGKRYGRLTVLQAVDLPSPESNGNRLGWLCRCDCGNEIVKTYKELCLSKGKVQSCGCLLRERALQKALEHNVFKHFEGTAITAINPDRKPNKNNTSGVKGVYWSKADTCWIAKIGLKNKSIYLGRFAHLEDAIKAREAAEEEYYKPLLEKYKEGI